MNKTREVNFKKDVSVIGSLNITNTALLGTLSLTGAETDKSPYFLKAIFLGPEYMKRPFELNLKKLYGNSQSILSKPERFAYDEQSKCLFLISPIFGISLENIILFHKENKKYINPSLVYNFACKTYDMINKVKLSGTQLYHGNLKPSNIFYQQNNEEVEWKITEFGIPTNYPNKFYRQSQIDYNRSKTNISMHVENYDLQLHSLGVIILEMMTLLPIDDIYLQLSNSKDISTFKEIQQAQNQYGKQAIKFVNALFQPTQKTIKETFSNYRDKSPKSQSIPEYKQIAMTLKKLQKMAKSSPYERIVEKLKKEVQSSEISFDETLKKCSDYDPEYDFNIIDFSEIKLFLSENNISENSDDQVHELNFFLKIASQINYMQILKRAFSTKDIVEGTIKIAILRSDNRKKFFNNQISSNTQFWKASEISQFLNSLGVNLDEKQVEKVVKEWSGVNNRISVKYDQFNKVFKDIGNQPAMQRSQVKSNKASENQKDLRDILLQLRLKTEQSGKNLIQFFRVYDTNGKWVVPQDIEKHIKNKISIPDKLFNEICEQMWEEAGISGNSKKILQYVALLKAKKIYQLTELFKLVLVEKINQSDRESFFRSYEKDKKGWNIYSLMDFNENEQLDFTDPQLKAIFRQIDKDGSGYLDQKELIFRLTGLQQFDKEFIINKIKQEIGSKWDLFDVFMKFDKNGSLHYDSPGKLMEVFQYLEIQIPAQHCEDLFRNIMRNGKFPYMEFLRYFVSIEKLFLKSCLFFIDRIYEGNFEKFYEIGRIKNKLKWSKQSFDAVNDELLLGLTENQVSELWDVLSKNQSALTKQEVADVFNCSSEPEEAILGLQATNKRQEEAPIKKASQINKSGRKEEEKIKQIGKNDLISKLLEKNLAEIALCFIRKSRNNCYLTLSDFCTCLDTLQIKYLQNQVLKNTSQFQQMEEKSSSMKINFFNFLMFLCQNDEDEKQERKSQCLSVLIKELMKYNDTSTEEVFKKCRKPGIMKLTQFQNFIRNIVQSQIYYDDIQDVWKFYGYPDFLTPDDFTKIINFDGGKEQGKPRASRQFSFSHQENNRRSAGQESDDSPHFPKNANQRRQSKDKSKQANKNSKIEIPKNSYDKRKQENKRQEKQEISLFNRPARQKSGRLNAQKQNQSAPTSEKHNSKFEMKQISKGYVIEKFEKELRQKGSQHLNSLFSKSDTISTQAFINFIKQNYNFEKEESEKLGQVMGSFGKIKIQAVKKYIRKSESPSKKDEPTKASNQNDKKQYFKKEIVRDPRKNREQQSINEDTKLEDPKKLRLDIPLIKEHIKILVSSFSKRFDVKDIQPYFFERSANISKQFFIRKCLQINSSISKQIYQKIFLYLKPKQGLISSVSFKLSFNFDQEVQMQDIYFPEEIENQIKALFQKCDKDKSGFIQTSEIQNLLSQIGINESQKEIENYFRKIDQNFDKKISFKQFKLFIEQFALSFIGDFDEDVDSLNELLKMNDIFQTGFLPVATIALVLQKYGVKIRENDIIILNRYLANQNNEIEIKQLLFDIGHPAQSIFPSSLKYVLYKIRWRKKVTFKDIQKIFENISACFVMSYTSQLVKSKLLTPSTFITPILNESRMFYNDFNYKNINQIDPKQPVLISESKQTDLIVEIKLIDASGIPIPQNQNLKNGILNRSVNIILYDTSIESGKDCFTTIQVEFDADIEDQWIFNKNNRSIFIKIANYQNRKYEKVLLLFEFVITIVENGRAIDVSCGSTNFPIRELLVEAKIIKKNKITAGIPNKSKDIDKMSVSKRKGWRGLLGTGEVDSQFQIEVIPATKLQDKISMISALPEKSIINRKSVHFLWTFREYLALKAVDNKRINPDIGNHFIVKTFLLCLDVPDVNEELIPFWKQKIYQYELHKKQLLKIYENKSNKMINPKQMPQNEPIQNRMGKTNSFLNRMQSKITQISRENVKLLGKLESARPSVSRSLSESIDTRKTNRKIHVNPFFKQKSMQTEKENSRMSFKMKNMTSSLNQKIFTKDYAKSQQIKNRLRRYESMQNRTFLKSQRLLKQKQSQDMSQDSEKLKIWRSHSTRSKFQLGCKIESTLIEKQGKFYSRQQILKYKIDSMTNSLAAIRAQYTLRENQQCGNEDHTGEESSFFATQYKSKPAKKIIYID